MEELEENKEKAYNYLDWVEKYRPKTVKQVLLPSSYKKFFLEIVKSGNLPNLLLSSSQPGTGKTSLAKTLCNDLGMKYIYLNISMERGIDVLRSTIQSFASMRSISGKHKVVIMDEFDGATADLQNALKVAIEEYKNSCRFIMICNNVNKIITPLKEPGRAMIFDFNMSNPEFHKEVKPKAVYYLKKLLENEKVHYEEGSIEALVDKHYPSLRTCISILHLFYLLNGCITNLVSTFNDIGDEFFELILSKKFEAARKYIIDRGIPPNDIYSILYKKFIYKVRGEIRGEIIKIVDEQMYRSTLVVDPEITMASCLIKIMEIL